MSTVWPVDQQLSERIQMQVYRAPNGKQFYLPQTPTFGRVELIAFGGHTYLLAVENPPPDTRFDQTLGDDLQEHLDSRNLVPVGIYNDDPAVLLEEVGKGRLPAPDSESSTVLGSGPCAALLDPAPEPVELIGTQRQRLAERLHLVWNARRSDDPIPCLYGVDGMGKRAVAVAAAAMGERKILGVLPLASLLFDGMIELGHEKLSQAIAQLRSVPSDYLLIVSDAHLLGYRDQTLCNEVLLRQLSRLRCQVVLTASDEIPPSALMIGLSCEGLDKETEIGAPDSLSEAQRLARHFLEASDMQLDEEVLRMLIGYASYRSAVSGDVQVVPGRLLFLLRYTKETILHRIAGQSAEPAHHNARIDERRTLIAPDDIVDIAQIAKNAWQAQVESSTSFDPELSDIDPDDNIDF